MAILTLLAQACSRAFELGAYFWLAYWSTETVKASSSENPFSESKTLEYLGIYSVFGTAELGIPYSEVIDSAFC